MWEKCKNNYITRGSAEDNTELKMYNYPLIGVGDAKDELFKTFRDNNVIGDHYMLPTDWLADAENVISIFFPLTYEIRLSNRGNINEPSKEWLYARYKVSNSLKK